MISDNIKKLRNNLGMSQTEFADRLGVSSGVITNLEYGKLKDPEKKMPLFRLISKEFGVPVDWILNGGPLELPVLSDAEQEAKILGDMINSDDPVVKSFLTFWAQRTKAERELLSRQIIEFGELLKKNQE